jgi:sugar lactone lactonase YvrE
MKSPLHLALSVSTGLICSLASLLFAPLAAAQSIYTQPYYFSTIAGVAAVGANDGPGLDAQFDNVSNLALDHAGNLYAADTVNQTIRKITPAGFVTTIAGSPGLFGYADGIGSDARFADPEGLVADSFGNIYVADYYNFAIRKITPVGTNWIVTTIAGTTEVAGTADGTNGAARFGSFNHGGPLSVTIDAAGNLFVADTGNFTIRKITPVGTNWVTTTIAGVAGSTGTNDGLGSAARFNNPSALTADAAGNIFVTDPGSYTVRKLSPSGANWLVTTIAGAPGINGLSDGTNDNARFLYPLGIAPAPGGGLYVADSFDQCVRLITPSGADWVTTTFVGDHNFGHLDGFGTNAEFADPEGVASDSSGNLYVADTGRNSIRAVTPAGLVRTLAGAISADNINGPAAVARFNYPANLVLDSSNAIFLTDRGNNEVREISPAGIVTTLAGSAGFPIGSNDGVGTNAHFNDPEGIALDAAGNIYVADYGNNLIRRVTRAGTVTTLAGNPNTYASVDGTNSNAGFYAPHGIAVDNSGNLYVTEDEGETVRRLTPVGTNWVVTTIAGRAQVTGTADGLGPNARFGALGAGPRGIIVDAQTNLYVSDCGNFTIRKLIPFGTNWVVTTIAGSPGNGGFNDATNSDASFYYPDALAMDAAGNIFVADNSDHSIRRLMPSGTNWIVSTIGGSVSSPPGGADGLGMDAHFYYPSGVAVDALGNVYVADSEDNTIRKGVLTSTNPICYLQIPLQPDSAVQAGAGWRLPGDNFYANSPTTTRTITATNVTVQYNPIPGWTSPTNQTIALTPGLITINPAFYTVLPPHLIANAQGVALAGTPNTTYRIESTSSLKNPVWTGLTTNTITNTFNFNLAIPRTNQATTFYRAVWLNR